MKKKILSTATSFTILLVLLFISACSQDIWPPPPPTPQDEYLIDNLPGSENPLYELDKEKLVELVSLIEAGEFGKIHSLVIIHNDSLVLEKYFMGWTRHMLHYCFSATKSVTSALIGIAIYQGKVNRLDEKLLSFFPEYDDVANLDERKESITLENVLTMTAGFTWDEASTPKLDLIKMMQSSDWIKYVLDRPMSDDPGTKFLYNTGASHLLSGIIQNKTGQSAEEFAEENLFNLLGITKWEWKTDPFGLTNTGGIAGGLHLHPVNMAMFGYIYLKNGLLNDEQIVPENWVKESTSKHIGMYGYQWWVLPDVVVEPFMGADGIFFAVGYTGQYIFVIPPDMVVVSTAENLEDFSTLAFSIIFDYILPALQET